MALLVMIDFLAAKTISSSHRKKILWFGLFSGWAVLSKYQGIFLWVGALIYILIYNRNWLKEFTLYLAGSYYGNFAAPHLGMESSE